MRWHDLAFLHWPVAVETIRPHIPEALQIDTFDGWAWIGVVPFRMSGVRPRFVPPFPWFSAFPEINVRTYVSTDGKPGVWFFSLDAANPLAVRGARIAFGLPYFDATMRLFDRNGTIEYRSDRTHRHAPHVEFRGSYRPTGNVCRSQPGEIDYFLTERYCLYTVARGGKVCRGEIHHAPWPLQPGSVTIDRNTMAKPIGLALAEPPTLVHFARQLEVAAWLPEPI